MKSFERIKTHFETYPGSWISALELVKMGGLLSATARVRDCRKIGMVIENRQRRVLGRKISEYRYLPAPVTAAGLVLPVAAPSTRLAPTEGDSGRS